MQIRKNMRIPGSNGQNVEKTILQWRTLNTGLFHVHHLTPFSQIFLFCIFYFLYFLNSRLFFTIVLLFLTLFRLTSGLPKIDWGGGFFVSLLWYKSTKFDTQKTKKKNASFCKKIQLFIEKSSYLAKSE